MKNSTKFIWIVLAAIVVLLVIGILSFRNAVNDYIAVSENGNVKMISGREYDGKRIEKEYNFEDFSGIKISGGWDILIVRDDDYRITADFAPVSELEYSVTKSGNMLNLELDNRNSNFHGASSTIYMPELSNIKVEGAANINIEGFDMERLDLQLYGAGNIYAEDCEVDFLSLDSNGAVNINFRNSEVENAEVNLDGAGNVELNMTGGELKGHMGGLSRLEYSGEVKLLDVEKDGIGSVKHRD